MSVTSHRLDDPFRAPRSQIVCSLEHSEDLTERALPPVAGWSAHPAGGPVRMACRLAASPVQLPRRPAGPANLPPGPSDGLPLGRFGWVALRPSPADPAWAGGRMLALEIDVSQVSGSPRPPSISSLPRCWGSHPLLKPFGSAQL